MLTFDFIIVLLIAVMMTVLAFFCLINCIGSFINEEQSVVAFSLLFATVLSFVIAVFFMYGCVHEYNNGTPQRQYEIKKRQIIDAEKELQKWLIDHPEFKEE